MSHHPEFMGTIGKGLITMFRLHTSNSLVAIMSAEYPAFMTTCQIAFKKFDRVD